MYDGIKNIRNVYKEIKISAQKGKVSFGTRFKQYLFNSDTLEQADRLSDVSRVAFLIKEPSDCVDDYCNRTDHQDFKDYICSATDVEKAKRTCNETLRELNVAKYESIRNSSYFWMERTTDSTIERTLEMVEKHFQW